ncbi:MAG: MBOAT family O-acyltransferase [Oscillospiraceae bacterium]|nr:MBOAT family O-acyltransferase [Oscillospiraceae bacterium]
MLFNSWQFLVFYIVVFVLYYALPHRYRWVMLLLASYYFYACWNSELLILIMAITVVTYFCGRVLPKLEGGLKKLFLCLGTGIPLLALLFFKYFNFLGENLNNVFRFFALPVNISSMQIILPVGISFYTFQALSYVIDVYRGSSKVEKHIGFYALYISFFPQLVAGPIERSSNLLPQFYKEHKFNYDDVVLGLKTMTWGFFKKIVVADTLAIYVDKIYGSLPQYTGFVLLLASSFFAIQIYCDFSGYSDIAIGVAQTLGFRLMKNFNSPYFSKSIREFWKRWHISLSTFFMDYIYIPLGGSKVKLPRYVFNIMLTFIVSGLWHGANWTFVLWGGLHGIYIVAGRLTANLRKKMSQSLNLNKNTALTAIWKVCFTFMLVSVAWIFFRADTVNDAVYIFKNMFAGVSQPLAYITAGIEQLEFTAVKACSIILSTTLLFAFDFVDMKHDIMTKISNSNTIIRWVIYYAVLLMILVVGQFGLSQFIYFQF